MSTPTCDWNVDADRLMKYLDRPADDLTLQEHVAACGCCRERLYAMETAANGGGPTRRICSEHRANLPEFLEAKTRGEPLPERFAALQAHLVVCDDCFALYRELRLMDALVAADALPMPPRRAYRPPDLSFLSTPFEWVMTRAQEQGGRVLRALRLSLALLFLPPTTAPALVTVRKGRKGGPKVAVEVREVSLGAEQLGTLDVDVRLYADPHDPTLARLEVYARTIERPDLDFTGTRVALRLPGDREIVRHTNAAGLACFESLLEAELRAAMLEITPEA